MRKTIFSLIGAATLLAGCVVRDSDRIVSCGRGHRLQIVDLAMSPDPVSEGQRIGQFRVNLRADGSGECETRLQIRESDGNELIAAERVYRLRPGINPITLEPEGRYRFSRREHCFDVLANIENTPRRIDAARRFCAREIGGRRWSLR
ncbi:MAG TPA: hypothetical protein VNM15_08410 [Candidatus Binatia bacterium]|nr:hypothetical protein [Candidatus Binatia bacterium]